MDNLEKSNQYISELAKNVFMPKEKGHIKIGDWDYFVDFDLKKLKFKGQPLDLSDKSFLKSTGDYLRIAREFYVRDKDYYELDDFAFNEKLVMDLFANMTNPERENVDKHINQRISMLLTKNNCEFEPTTIAQMQGANLEICVLRNTSNLEAPFRFRTKLKNPQDEDEFFLLPDISFGTTDDCLHVYSIQRRRGVQSNKVSKYFDRYFRKTNKGVEMNDEIISEISTNALVSATVFLATFRKKGMKRVKAYGFIPERYNSKVETAIRKCKDENELKDYLKENDYNQFNITNKFYNTFIRYAHHFNTPVAYDDINECLEMDLKYAQNYIDDNIIHKIDEIVAEGTNVGFVQ